MTPKPEPKSDCQGNYFTSLFDPPSSALSRPCHNCNFNWFCLVFKFWTIGGIFLYMFSDALLFDMMLNTAFEDGIGTIEDLIDMDIRLGKYSG